MSTQYIRYPSVSGGSGITTYSNLAAFPASASDGAAGIALDTDVVYVYNLASTTWKAIGSPSTILGLGTANGLSVTSQLLSLQLATTSLPGALSAADWTTFNGKQAAGSYLTALTGDVVAAGPGSSAATIQAGAVTNAKIAAGAGIPYSKLTLTGAVLNADLAGSIAYSKLSLTGAILNADLAGSIAYSKLSLTGAILNADLAGSIAYSKLSLTGAILNADLAGSIAFSKLAALTSANIIVGNVSNVAAAVAVTGDISLSNAGVTAYNGTVPINKGGSGQTSAAAAFNALAPATAKGGSIVGSGANAYANIAVGADNKTLLADATSTNGQSWQFPANAKNYVSNPSFESNTTTNWSLGTVGTLTNAIPTGSPTFGSGASGNLSIATVGSGQLAGTNSLSLVSSAATTVGNMLATAAMTIDAADQAKVLSFKFYYSAFSGATNCNFSGTSSNSFGVAIYDVTNSAWLTSTANFGMTQSSGVGYVTGTCQTNATTASLRFVIYNANATAGAATLYFDDFYLGPQTAPVGTIITDWVAYTPVFTGYGTVTGISFFSRRVGGDLEVHGTAICGTATAVPNKITMGFNGGSGNVTLDTARVAQGTALGTAGSTTASTTYFSMNVLGGQSDLTVMQLGFQTSVAQSTVSGAGINVLTSILGNGTQFVLSGSFPIAGWSSNVQMSSDTDTRVVAASYKMSLGNITPGTNTQINYDSKLFDTHAAVTTGTGAWKFTAPVTGTYVVTATSNGNANGTINLYKNGSSYAALTESISTGAIKSGTATLALNAGDYVDARPDGTAVFNTGSISIFRLSGPSVIARSETVAAYGISGGSNNTTSGTSQLVSGLTVIKDTHAAFSAGTTFTAPMSGFYNIAINIGFAASATGIRGAAIYKGGVQQALVAQILSAGAGPDTIVGGSAILSLNAGDLITFFGFQNSGGTLAIVGAETTWSIFRIG